MTDHRKALPEGTILEIGGIRCEVGREIGRGFNSIVYTGRYRDNLYRDQFHHVLVKELFPIDPDRKIIRAEDGRICVEPGGEETFQRHRQSFEAGNRAQIVLLKKWPDNIGGNLNTCRKNGTLYTVLSVNGGETLAELSKKPARSLRQCTERMLSILDALEVFHGSGFLHLDIAPDNILFSGTGNRERAILIDYNSVTSVDVGARGDSVTLSIKQGYTAPEIRAGQIRKIGCASDLYSVTAVFYRMLMGTPLTGFQMIRRDPPDVSECPCVKTQAETVKVWVREILRKGLKTIPEKRYQNIAEMRRNLTELIDRIDGVGVTHWALWEAGRRQAARMIRENPSLSFIAEPSEIYPVMVSEEADTDGKKEPGGRRLFPAGEYIYNLRENCMLLAGGGMGKTTALLRIAFAGSRHFAPDRPAVLYLPLHGWKKGSSSFITDSLLEGLHFHPDTHTFEDARKALKELLDRPFLSEKGEGPSVVLLLDGLNETAGNAGPLLDEITKIASMQGVRVVAAGRNEEKELPFRHVYLEEMTDEAVLNALSKNGLLLPESPDMRKLLRIPMMLSMYIRSGQMEGKQVRVHTQEKLIGTYLSALREKACRELPEEDDRRWQIEAATEMILPVIAAEIHKKGRALDDRELLPAVSGCFRILNGKLSGRFFPKWIGRTKPIRGDAGNAEEWYGLIVQDILWKDLGLIVRDEQKRYTISHQLIAESLLDHDRQIRERVSRYRRTRIALIAICILLSAAIALQGYRAYIHSQTDFIADGFEYKLESDELTLVHNYGMETEIVIPSKVHGHPVTAIGESAFEEDTDLVSVTIPDSVTRIGNRAFFNCSALSGITIPDSVTEIADWAFYNCGALDNITIPDSVMMIGSAAFCDCSALTSITIPGSVMMIGSNAFAECTSLTEVTIPEGVTSMGDYVFSECDSLTSAAFPDSLTDVGENPFFDCDSLSEIYVEADHSYLEMIDGELYSKPDRRLICAMSTSGHYSIEPGTRVIGAGAFGYCETLTDILIPDSVEEIGEMAFFSAGSLKRVTIPNGVSELNDYVFYMCESLEEVNLPDGLTVIGGGAFIGCESLENLYIPESVTYIENSDSKSVFRDCDSLVLSVPEGSYAENYAQEEDIPCIVVDT